jgi:hypothetical protein
MIKYALECEEGHRFESWFQSNSDFDALKKSGHLSCTVCGSVGVDKSLMAPRVSLAGENTAAPGPALADADTDNAIAKLRREVEETSDYVGDKFAAEARAMHLGDKPTRSIYGEAGLDQAKSLIEDGVPLMPLPFAPKKKLS